MIVQQDHNLWSRFETLQSSKLFILIGINLAIFTDAYLYGLIVPVLPFALVERVKLPEDEVQKWIGTLLAAYGAGVLVGSPLAGWVADRSTSRRIPYLAGLVALASSTLAFSVGRTTVTLLAGRLVQGFSSAIVHTVGMAILADIVDESEIGFALGVVTMNIAAGVLFGPVFGGILYDQRGYDAVFVSAFILIAVDIVLRIFMVTEKPVSGKADVVYSDDRTYGTMHGAPTMVPDACDTQSIAPSVSVTQPLLPKQCSAAVVEIHQQSHPIKTLISTPRFLVALGSALVQTTVLTGLEAIIPLRIKTIFGYNSTSVALIFLCITIPALLAPLIGLLSDRYGVKVLVSSGFLFLAPVLVSLRFIDHYDTSQVVLLCALLALLGVSLHMIMTPINSEAMHIVDDMEAAQPGIFGNKGAYALAFGMINAAFAGGLLLGPLAGSSLIAIAGWNNLTLGTAVLSALCVVPASWALGGKSKTKAKGFLISKERNSEA